MPDGLPLIPPPLKRCTACSVERPLTEFSPKPTATDGRQSHCKPCKRLESKAHYEKHKADYIERAGRHRKARARRMIPQVRAVSASACSCCGVPITDGHRLVGSQQRSANQLAWAGYSKKRILTAAKTTPLYCPSCAAIANNLIKSAIAAHKP